MPANTNQFGDPTRTPSATSPTKVPTRDLRWCATEERVGDAAAVELSHAETG